MLFCCVPCTVLEHILRCSRITLSRCVFSRLASGVCRGVSPTWGLGLARPHQGGSAQGPPLWAPWAPAGGNAHPVRPRGAPGLPAIPCKSFSHTVCRSLSDVRGPLCKPPRFFISANISSLAFASETLCSLPSPHATFCLLGSGRWSVSAWKFSPGSNVGQSGAHPAFMSYFSLRDCRLL